VATLAANTAYYVTVLDDYTFGLSTTPGPSFTTINITAPSGATSEGFRKVVVNLETNRFTIPNHGFLANQPVRYRTNEQDEVTPLQDNATYYIKEVVDANTFTLSQSLGGPELNLTSLGQGTVHSFIFTVVNELEDSIYIPSHGFVTGQTVQYAKSRDFVKFVPCTRAVCTNILTRSQTAVLRSTNLFLWTRCSVLTPQPHSPLLRLQTTEALEQPDT